ncbi:unnamed protein product [Cuscuta europaea]|uniref:Reverse transcriptase Ty1/copia-type domain-containing protein n=1 Tax=Cuscuta europaea TaxID=41803 RepID=A0A9P1E352_CUSEU|nr:unnamed protein product [Cuscuta europaea]
MTSLIRLYFQEPLSYQAVVRDPHWREAMWREIDALEANGTWNMVDLPTHTKPIDCKWVYKIKHNSNGSIEQFKARPVVCVNHQVEGIDYHETSAPVAKMTTVRTLLAVAASKNWELHQMDVDNVFFAWTFGGRSLYASTP